MSKGRFRMGRGRAGAGAGVATGIGIDSGSTVRSIATVALALDVAGGALAVVVCVVVVGGESGERGARGERGHSHLRGKLTGALSTVCAVSVVWDLSVPPVVGEACKDEAREGGC